MPWLAEVRVTGPVMEVEPPIGEGGVEPVFEVDDLCRRWDSLPTSQQVWVFVGPVLVLLGAAIAYGLGNSVWRSLVPAGVVGILALCWQMGLLSVFVVRPGQVRAGWLWNQRTFVLGRDLVLIDRSFGDDEQVWLRLVARDGSQRRLRVNAPELARFKAIWLAGLIEQRRLGANTALRVGPD